ncbi:MAG: formate dehydrogenase subunit delta [Dongiaceae bacterium]
MTTQRLVHMANQVASFFAAYPEAEAIENTASHLKSFWDPRMRREIEAHLKEKAGAGLSHIAMEAVKIIAAKDAAKKSA